LPGLLTLPLPLQLFLSSAPNLLRHGTFMPARCVLRTRLERKREELVSPPLGSVRMKYSFFFVRVNNNQPPMRRRFTWEALQLSAKQSSELPQRPPAPPCPRGRERGEKSRGGRFLLPSEVFLKGY